MTLRAQAGSKKTSVTALVVITCVTAPLLMVSVTGCARHTYHPSTIHQIEGNRTTEPGYNQPTDQRVEDRRTAERVREALAAGADYRYDAVKVTVCDGVVELSGSVITGAHRNRAGEVTRKVVGVKDVENNLAVRD